LTVSNSAGFDTLLKTDLITAQAAPPAASFVGTPTQGLAPLNVSFADNSSGDIDSWFWDFGDGSTSTTQHPIHLYNLAGLYTVSLTVGGPGGTSTEVKSDLITVDPAGPFADFAATPLSGTEPLAVAFTDLSGGWPDTWQWDFGDGNASTDQNPMHVYVTPGTFTVSLFATGADGTDAVTKADLITVDEYIPPPFTLEVMSLDTNPLDNRINFAINVVNSYGVDTDLSDLTVRYWFTQEYYGTPMLFHCDYALLGMENISGTFGTASGVMADRFVEVHFEESAGVLLAGAQTGQIQIRVHNIDFSALDENNDYSWMQEVTLTPHETVTLYQGGSLVWGVEP
jgi:PKD repeat protein